MTHYVVSMVWPEVPEAQRRCLIALLGQMATRQLATTQARKENAYDGDDREPHRSLCQDSGAASRPPGRGVCTPIDTAATGAPPGVDPPPIRPRGAGAGLRLGPAPGARD